MRRRRKRSKKPSAASSTARPPRPLVVYLDESIFSRRLAETLEANGVEVRRPGVDIPFGSRDEDWLAAAGRQGWIVLLRDQRVRHRTTEREALVQAGVGAFVFTGGQVAAEDTAEVFGRLTRKLVNISGSERKPFLYAVTAGGRLTKYKLRMAGR